MAMAMPLSAREGRGLEKGQILAGTLVSARGKPTNPLLLRDTVGKAKPSCYDLPEEQFAFGRPGNQDLEGAREVSMNWVSHMRSERAQHERIDFVAFNKKAAVSNITNAKDLKHMKREHDMSATPRVAEPSVSENRSRKVELLHLPSHFTHGRKVRPSTPIGDVLSHRFGDQAERENWNYYADFQDTKESMRTQVRKIPLTAASRGHASTAKKAMLAEAQDNQELFKLGRFTKRAHAKINNGRKPTANIAWESGLSSNGDDELFYQGLDHREPSEAAKEATPPRTPPISDI